MFSNELDEAGRPICTQCGEPVYPNDWLSPDSDQRGTAAYTAEGGIVIVHKSCAKDAGLPF